MPWDVDEILFRSPDGATLYARDGNGVLRDIPARGERASWRGDGRHRVLAAALDRFGLWSHLSDEDRATARQDVETGCYPLDSDRLFGRVLFHADGEEIAEGGVERFLTGLAPELARFGVTLDVSTVESPYRSEEERDYVVALNGIRCLAWADEEWHGGEVWSMATVRPLAVVNRLLADVGRVRAHTLVTGGNEGLLLFVDPRVADAMRASGLFPDDAVPALAR